MVTSAWCERCQLPGEMCEHRPAVQQAGFAELYELATADDGHRIGPLIVAQYSGRCTCCTDPWQPGELIARDEAEDAWICAGCAG